MEKNFDLEKFLKKFHHECESKVDSPEDFKNSHNDSPDTEEKEEPYCQWLDDLGWI